MFECENNGLRNVVVKVDSSYFLCMLLRRFASAPEVVADITGAFNDGGVETGGVERDKQSWPFVKAFVSFGEISSAKVGSGRSLVCGPDADVVVITSQTGDSI